MIGARVEALRAQGAEAFDGPGLRGVEALARRAEAFEGPTRDRLRARAEARLAVFERRLAAARAEAEAALAEAHEAGAEVAPLRAALEAGAVHTVLRQTPRALRAARRPDPRHDRERLLRLANQARARGMALPEGLSAAFDATQGGRIDVRALGDQLARQLFRDAAQQARAAVSLARATEHVPEAHGPYNPRALVADLLARLEQVSPAYLRATLAGFEDLAALRALPEPTPPNKRRRRRATK